MYIFFTVNIEFSFPFSFHFESRLEGGGVNRQNLKIINLSTTTSRG
jgi:hypothetical protein